MSASILAVQHLRRMRGGSQSHLLRALDGGYYVTKFRNNPQHVRVLANEMLATRLGQYLGLPMPPVEVIDVSGWLIEHTPELRIEVRGLSELCSTGTQLASRYVCDATDSSVLDYLPEAMLDRVVNIEDFARVLVLDKWTCNSDARQGLFVCDTIRCKQYRVFFIDQGYCFNAGEWSFPDGPLRGVYTQNRVYQQVSGWESFEPALTLAEQIDVNQIWRCAKEIPEEWYENDSDGLDRLVETLHRRRSLIRDLITSFRNSPRNPFPQWARC
jgi:hypothetical protein